ncbi:hypothetical protein G134_142 [Lactobacillus delbrueckii subsp. lactis CRL581]|nr:hypothetical protein HMPREF9264_1566 [Lactobacillus delbrueckii subsp. bulgaricus PB2003/044-T3-4]EPB98949.1 hypothetical protein G134_142 [Lactobacillus delbrueckii subsp. lactis CRL581]
MFELPTFIIMLSLQEKVKAPGKKSLKFFQAGLERLKTAV